MTEEQVFLAALDLPDAGERSAYLDTACGGDTELRRQVEELLVAHFKSGEFLNEPLGLPRRTNPATANLAETLYIPEEDAVPGEKKSEEDPEDLHFLQPSTRPDSLGRIGHYEVLEILGKGGFGMVFRAFDDVLQRVVALKVLAPAIAATSPARKRFLREAQASARVRHENVVQVHAVEESPIPYLVMEFIAGETLQERLNRKGPLGVAEIVSLGRQIAEGLAAAHATGLIHRDIKPGNILIEGGTSDRVKITDFGLARAADDASMTQSGVLAGTPMFMAPEQAQGDTLDQRADLFSLGSVLYVMASGRPPFRAATTFAVLKRVVEEDPRPITDLIPEMPQWLCDIIAKLHAKKPNDRYQSAREVANVLANCETQLKEHSRVKDLPLIPRAKKKQSMGWRWFAAAALLLLMTEITGTTHLHRNLLRIFNTNKPGVDPLLVGQKELPASLPAADGFVQLFNGKDLTGWKTHPKQPGGWSVNKGGDLVGSGLVSHLFSDRADYRDFHLRVCAKINFGGDSGLFLRSEFGLSRLRPKWGKFEPDGYEVQIFHDQPGHWSTGSLIGRNEENALALVDTVNIVPDQWFTMEVIAKGNRIEVRVDGKSLVNFVDEGRQFMRGHIALQVNSPNTIVQFRKIEIKELPPEEPDWVQLFNRKDLTGWKYDPKNPGKWRVENGILTSDGPAGYLFSERGDFENFHVRTEVLIPDDNCYSGLFFRTPFGSTWKDGAGQPGLNGYATPLQPFDPPGSLVTFAEKGPTVSAPAGLVKPGQWYTLEVIAQGNRLTTKIDGTTAATLTDSARHYTKGHLALQQLTAGTRVQFRKIEIKELSPAVDKTPPLAVAPFNAVQAKQHQEAWAKHLGILVEHTSASGMKFRLIPPGEFTMGSSPEEIEQFYKRNAKLFENPLDASWHKNCIESEGPAHLVKITRPFYLGATHVTVGQFRQFVKQTKHSVVDDRWEKPGWEQTDDHPVVFVAWSDAAAYCQWLGEQEGGECRLPTEAEWEYACRAGTTTRYWFGDDEADVPRFAWLKPNSEGRTHPIGKLAANPFGLYDIHGNAWQWCDDLNDMGFYKKSPTEDPLCERGDGRVIRGGSWQHDPLFGRSAFRNCTSLAPISQAEANKGFRVMLSVSGISRTKSAAEQIKELRQELQRLNQKFDGELEHKADGDVVTELSFNTDEVDNIAPLRRLTGLVDLNCRGTYPYNGKLSDLSPLKGLKLSRLDCSSTKVDDLTPLAGMPLTFLHFNHNQVSDLTPLQGMSSLVDLGCAETKVSDFSPLQGLKLQMLGAQLLAVKDLSPLRGMPLKGFDLYDTVGATDLEPLRGMPLDNLNLQNVPVKDLSPLEGMTSLRSLQLQKSEVTDLSPLQGLKLTTLFLRDKQISDLSPLKGMPLVKLEIYGTGVSDLKPLAGMPLQEIRLTPQNITEGMEILREIKSLQNIGIDSERVWPAAEFWQRHARGEFAP